MWRTRAVLALLYEEIAGLPRAGAETPADRGDELARLRRRARIVVALDWAAILVLVLLRDPRAAFFTLGPTETTVFTLAILAVAVHSGFRLGQLDKLGAVARAGGRLAAADPEP